MSSQNAKFFSTYTLHKTEEKKLGLWGSELKEPGSKVKDKWTEANAGAKQNQLLTLETPLNLIGGQALERRFWKTLTL